MERCSSNTLARTLQFSTPCVKLALIATVFLPYLVTVNRIHREPSSLPAEGAEPGFIVETAPLPKAEPPTDLVKIFSIVKTSRPDINDDNAWDMSDVIRDECKKHNLDPILVLALIQVESGFQFDAVSPMGARGIMQIMPDVAQWIVRQSGVRPSFNPRRFRPEYLDDPVFNIRLGVYYLHDLKKSFRNVSTALVAYNLGPTELRNRLDNNIEFSDEYANAVLSTYQKFKKAKQATS
jgi:Transglycosylase SLT domain